MGVSRTSRAAAVDLLRREIDREALGGDDEILRVGGGLGPAYGGAQPGEQFVHAEGLGDVVVRAGVERLDLLVGSVAGGEHQDRHARPAPQPLDDLDAVHVGQTEVEDDHVGVAGGGELKGARAVVGGVHLVLAGAQIDRESAYDLRFVVDHEHPRHPVAGRP